MSRIRDLREQLGLTQEEMAEAIGVSRITYIRYENEERSIKAPELISLARVFNCSADYLLGLSESPNVYISNQAPLPAKPDPESMPKDIEELKQLIRSIVNQVLASNQQPSDDRAAPAGPPVRRSVGKE